MEQTPELMPVPPRAVFRVRELLRTNLGRARNLVYKTEPDR
jgi:hypothetical protein